uniref:Uncharacterized protein n=1 Tax=Rhizophora mucronata TaxID=61149 RepID=A0A2P2P4L9_RHIMU
MVVLQACFLHYNNYLVFIVVCWSIFFNKATAVISNLSLMVLIHVLARNWLVLSIFSF